MHCRRSMLFGLMSALAGSADITFGETGAEVNQSVLNPAGVQARHVGQLWNSTAAVLAVIYIIVIVVALLPVILRRAQRVPAEIQPTVDPLPDRSEWLKAVWVSIGVALTTVILFFLLVGDFRTGNRVRSLSHDTDALTIKVTGHQWWWEVQYENSSPSQIVYDANEIHIPTDRTVRLDIQSIDVIHSFWVPNLAGKKDMIPGHPTSLWLNAEREGTYWGQCAEYCGLQHAHMRFAVVAQSPDEFARWLAASHKPAHEPINEVQKSGQRVFLGYTCSMCHTIRGTKAGGRLGPDLTHVASRQSLAAGSLPNSMGHLGGWVVDPQGVKPGVIMPQHSINPDDLQVLLEYLESLK